MGRRCDECGRFCRELYEVWGSWPTLGPDHEACGDCRPELRPSPGDPTTGVYTEGQQ